MKETCIQVISGCAYRKRLARKQPNRAGDNKMPLLRPLLVIERFLTYEEGGCLHSLCKL